MTDGAARDPLIGSSFNNYRIDALLARGGMGAVYLVRDAILPRIRKVLKVILPEFANNAFIKERFLREAEAVSVLRHRNIVGIDAIGSLPDGRLCMLIPFLEGKPLDQFMAEHGGRLAPHRVMHIIAHIACGLDHAHRQGIVHCDLKPGNVFVESAEDDRYFCKVLDFGIAKQLNARVKRPSPTLSGPVGTPCYMAVEQYANAADVTPVADVFALAVMAWQMVTGCLPWGEADPAALYQKQLHESPARPVGNYLSLEWEAILRSALSPDPRLRPQSMRQLVQALASMLLAIEPLFPSGAEILRRVAPNLVANSAHDDETVRNQSERPMLPAWPVRETPLPGGEAGPSGTAPSEAVESPPCSAKPTVNEPRGVPAIAPGHPTTLGSSTGAIEPHDSGTRRRKRARLGLAAFGSIGVATLVLVAVARGGGNATPQVDTIRPSASPTTAPAPMLPSAISPVPVGAAPVTHGPAAPTTPIATPPMSTAAGSGSAGAAHAPMVEATPAAAPKAALAGNDQVLIVPSTGLAHSRAASSAFAPAARFRTPLGQQPVSSAPTIPSRSPVPGEHVAPKVPPAEPLPNHDPARLPGAGSAAPHLDRNAVGGQEEN